MASAFSGTLLACATFSGLQSIPVNRLRKAYFHLLSSLLRHTDNVSDGEAFPDLLGQIEDEITQASADGAYDDFKNHQLLEERGAKITIPPRENAKIRQRGVKAGKAGVRSRMAP